MNDDFASKLQAEGERRQGGAMRDLPAACKTDPHGQVGRDASGEESSPSVRIRDDAPPTP